MPDLHTPAGSSTDFSELCPAIRDAIDDSIAKIVQIQDDEGPPAAERFKRIERQTREVCMELGRRVLQGVLEDRDARLPDAVKRGGRTLRRRKATPKTIATLLGRVTCKRSRYRTCEAGASRAPVDDGLGLIHGHLTRPMARVCVLTASHCPARDARGILAEIGGASPSAGTLQRVTRSMNAELEKLPSERRTRIRSAEDIPADACSLSVSLDGVMVPLTQGEDGRSEGAWREASCGAVSFQDAQGRRRKTVYLGRMPEAGKATLKAEIKREVARIREAGDHPPPGSGRRRRRAGQLAVSGRSGARRQRGRFLARLPAPERRRGPCARAIRHLRDTARARTARKELDRELAFFRKNRRRMRYAALADKAMGIGSGVVEAANKVLVVQRMKRSGMRWRIRTGQAVLSFRVLQKSGVFDRTWSDLMDLRDAAANDSHPLPARALAA